MTQSKHTPGPWIVHPYRDTAMGPYNKAIEIGPHGIMVAKICGAFEQPEAGPEAEANARLIAAAPELLEALEHLRNICVANGFAFNNTERGEVIYKSNAAIAKAKGE